MSISQVTRTGQPTNYGLGWYVDTREGRRLIYHTGHQQGTKTLLASLPDQQAVVAIMANSENADQFRLLDAVVRRCLLTADSARRTACLPEACPAVLADA